MTAIHRALRKAIESGDFAGLRLHLDADPAAAQGLDYPKRIPLGEVPLIFAAVHDAPDAIAMLAACGADLNFKAEIDFDRCGALHMAAAHNSARAIRALAGLGVEIDTETSPGWSPLRYAVEAGALDATEALLDACADPRRLNFMGAFSAHKAKPCYEAAFALARRRADMLDEREALEAHASHAGGSKASQDPRL